MLLRRIDEALRGTGLFVRGAFRPGDADGVPVPATTVVLIGNAGAAVWRAFDDRVPEDARDRQTDPLDGWVRRIIEAIAARFGAAALYPFEGPSFLPFSAVGDAGGAGASVAAGHPHPFRARLVARLPRRPRFPPASPGAGSHRFAQSLRKLPREAVFRPLSGERLPE